MDEKENRDKERTSEEYRQEAEEHIESLKQEWKVFGGTGIIVIAAVVAVIIICLAWFASNRQVSGGGMSVQVAGSDFELASVGTTGAFDDSISEDLRVTGDSLPNDEGTITSGVEETILWRLSDQSNMGNKSGDTGIHPGSYGKLKFYVIPKQSGTLTLSFNLELILMDKNKVQISSEALANKLIRGHMLFSYQCAQDKDYNSNSSPILVNYLNPTFTLTFEDAVKDTRIPVELNWIWPLLLDNIRKDNLHNVCSKEPILKWMNQNPEYFFYNNGNGVTAPVDFDNDTQFRTYNNYFNNADQYIGENLDWLMVRLSAQQV